VKKKKKRGKERKKSEETSTHAFAIFKLSLLFFFFLFSFFYFLFFFLSAVVMCDKMRKFHLLSSLPCADVVLFYSRQCSTNGASGAASATESCRRAPLPLLTGGHSASRTMRSCSSSRATMMKALATHSASTTFPRAEEGTERRRRTNICRRISFFYVLLFSFSFHLLFFCFHVGRCPLCDPQEKISSHISCHQTEKGKEKNFQKGVFIILV
jgi:hypothetical protein